MQASSGVKGICNNIFVLLIIMSPSTLFLLRVSTLIAFTLSYAVDFTPQWEPVVRGEIVIIL